MSDLIHLQICTHMLSLTVENFVQASSATATFAMTFSSSMSVVEYYILRRFPLPYGTKFRRAHTYTHKHTKLQMLSLYIHCYFGRSLLCCGGSGCFIHWATCGEKDNHYNGKDISHHLHFGFHNFCQCYLAG